MTEALEIKPIYMEANWTSINVKNRTSKSRFSLWCFSHPRWYLQANMIILACFYQVNRCNS